MSLWPAGLDQEGLYRVNGNARTIEKLKASFDKGEYSMSTLIYINFFPHSAVGDADFSDADVAAVGGLLKLFLVSAVCVELWAPWPLSLCNLLWAASRAAEDIH